MALSKTTGQQPDAQSCSCMGTETPCQAAPQRSHRAFHPLCREEKEASGVCPDPRSSRQDKQYSWSHLGMQKSQADGCGCSVFTYFVFKRTFRPEESCIFVRDIVCYWDLMKAFVCRTYVSCQLKVDSADQTAWVGI